MSLKEVKYITKNYPDCIVQSGFVSRYMIFCAYYSCCLFEIKWHLPGGFIASGGSFNMGSQSIHQCALLKLSSMERHLSCMFLY